MPMLICVTQRMLCQEDFLHRIQQLAQAKPYAVMLREKDLDLPSYERLTRKVKEICEHYQVLLIIHQHAIVAETLGLTHLQLSMPALRTFHRGKYPLVIGASVHSVAEAQEAKNLGASYLVVGHIYATDCKKGLAPRGLSLVRQVCQAVNLPVFAIGGITRENAAGVLGIGAKGICVMSEAMTCKDPMMLVHDLKKICHDHGSRQFL